MPGIAKKKVILLVESSRAFGQLLVKGVVEYARFHAQWSFYREAGHLSEHAQHAVDWNADGIIAHVVDAKTARRVIPQGLPAVVKGKNELIPGVCNIVGDTEAVARAAAEHLANLALSNFAFCGFTEVLWTQEFYTHFSQNVRAKGFQCAKYCQVTSAVTRSWQRELDRLVKWLRSLPKPVGIMACNDDRGQHLIEAARITGLRVPDDVAIIGVDNDEWICNLTTPPLTSIALNTERAGYEAAALLDRLMCGERMMDQKVIIGPSRVIARQSTNILSISDPEVLAALRFIHANFNEPIQSNDVVMATTMGRRTLYNRFKKVVGRSIGREIRRLRAEHLAQMLVETSLPISRIVANCKYATDRNIARYFRLEKGMSLLQYRQKYGHPL